MRRRVCRGDLSRDEPQGIAGEEIFRNDRDRRLFMDTLTEACAHRRPNGRCMPICLMRNHFHLVIETPQPNLVAGMKWLLGVYTKRFNISHAGECGHLFAGRYKALHVEGSGDATIWRRCATTSTSNPARAGLLQEAANPLEAFPWSSYGDFTSSRPPAPGLAAGGAVAW